MQLYHLPLHPPTAITHCLTGYFSGAASQEFCLIRGNCIIELHRLDPRDGSLKLLCHQNAFCHIRSIAAVRPFGAALPAVTALQEKTSPVANEYSHAGQFSSANDTFSDKSIERAINKECLLCGTDSGRLVILQYDDHLLQFVPIASETFGKSGIRRTVPGEHIAAEPLGRAIMIAAVEKTKLAYIISRDVSNGQVLVSSPLECSRGKSVCMAVVGLDVGAQGNPCFAALELDYSAAEVEPAPWIPGQPASQQSSAMTDEQAAAKLRKRLVLYEVDLALNQLHRRRTIRVSRDANMLIAVPRHNDKHSDRQNADFGPGGVLVCSVGRIDWYDAMALLRDDGLFGRMKYSVAGGKPKSVSTSLTSLGMPLPRAKHQPLIISAMTHRSKDSFFFLLLNDEGDVFKLDLMQTNKKSGSHAGYGLQGTSWSSFDEIQIRYLDTVEPALCACLSKNGFILVSSEQGASHSVYQIQSLGDDSPIHSSKQLQAVDRDSDSFPKSMDIDQNIPSHTSRPESHRSHAVCAVENNPGSAHPYFTRHSELCNLRCVALLDNWSPILDARIATESTAGQMPALYLLHGKHQQPRLSVMKRGFPLEELATTPLPIKPTAIWTLPVSLLLDGPENTSSAISAASAIFISSGESTLILSVGDSIDEVDGTALGFSIQQTPTVGVHSLQGHSSIVQVLSNGYVQVGFNSADNRWSRLTEWHLPSTGSSITSSCSNGHQLVLLANGNQLRYFEATIGASHPAVLRQVGPVKTVPMTICCLAMASPPEGSLRSDYLLVACQEDCTIRLINLAHHSNQSKGKETKLFEMLALQMLSQPATSMILLPSGSQSPHLHLLLVGHADGTVSRLWLDSRTGSLLLPNGLAAEKSDGDDGLLLNKVFGPGPVQLLPCRQANGTDDGVLAISAHRIHRVILHHDDRHASHAALSNQHLSILPVILPSTTPMVPIHGNDSALLHASIATDSIFGLVRIQGNALSIMSYLKSSIEVLSSNGLFISSSHVLPSGMAGKRLIEDGTASTGLLAILQSNQMVLPSINTESNKAESANTESNKAESVNAESKSLLSNGSTYRSIDNRPSSVSKGSISFYSPHLDQLLPFQLYLPNDFVPLSACFVPFHTSMAGHSSSDIKIHLVVGAASADYDALRKTASSFQLCTFSVQHSRHAEMPLSGDNSFIQFIHSTAVSNAPLALAAFHGMLLAGTGPTLTLYDLGLRKLLRKCELTSEIPFCIASIGVDGMRIFLGDVKDGFLFVLYRLASNEFFLFADDCFQRWLLGNRPCILDADTVAGCDKFGNFFACRLPEAVQQGLQQDPNGGTLSRKPWLMGAPYKTEVVASWHMDGLSGSLQKAQLVPAGRSVLVHFGIHGHLGCLVPLASQAETDLLHRLEQAMRECGQPSAILGREHLHWRGYHEPVQGVLDGELCELFIRLPLAVKQRIALAVGSSIAVIEGKLEWLRTVSCF